MDKSLPGKSNRIHIRKEDNGVPLCKTIRPVKASITLEAAIVVPLVAGFLATILFWFRVLEVETEVYEALAYASRQTAAVARLSDSEAAELAVAEGFFLSKLSKAETAGNYLSSAQKTIILAGSKLDGDYVDLIADYRVGLPVAFFSLKDIHIRQESKSRKWTGSTSDGTDDVYVYVTETGTVYHLTKECKYLDLSIQTAGTSEIGTLCNKSGHKYSACSRCAAKNNGKGIVYITDYGDNYHCSLGCSGLKRTISLVLKSEVEDKNICSKCKKNAKR
jgi:hypothetical protein